MKKLIYLFTAILCSSFAVNATTNLDNNVATANYSGYGNSFIFVEGGIEFSIFPDGQFDFYMPQYGPNVNVAINTPGVSISFNSGYDYNGYVQYDAYGAIVQIEHVPVFYDFYGRVNRIGNIYINYNGFGFVSRVGGLYVHYRNRVFSHYTGFINVYNRHYVYRPWHRHYVVPSASHCVVYHKPYRKHYKPQRHHFTSPYRNNYRRTTAVASRRGHTITRRQDLATRTPVVRNRTATHNQNRRTVDRNRNHRTVTSAPGRSKQVESPRRSVNKRTQVNSPRSKTNRQTVTRPSRKVTQTKRNVSKNTTYRKNSSVRKPNRQNTRKYTTRPHKSNRVASRDRR
ncbi:hypothetical protein [Mangrovimonas yunxiaonensis]|uniref:hypothetical protein n=1 Tax=Mangrovimonas yunxiaonensis TaxID=1197477 RepID=UPI00068F9FE7|nr:hypothetical protein [Mangrovimonas yunxiaonensis]GGH41534.1 hypothetical protein GCM10011364_12390 [Mangrovimonas yunxiaonensis]